MKSQIAFSSENTLLSIAGHLLVIALLVTSFAVLNNTMDRIVASDQIQIMEIDLTQVKITGDETLVFNTDVPEKPKKEEVKEEKKEEKKESEPIGDEPMKEFEMPAVVPETPKAEPKPEAPKAPTIVRVNRETTSLNRTMTVSVVDALRVAMTRCWVFDRNYPGIEDIRAVAHLTMNQRGYVASMWLEQESAASENPALAYIFETIRTAISNCQPFSMLPENEFDRWQKIQLTFYPSSGQVQ
ncbi:MAG: hypothetical protein FWE50_04275 [Alphaproteobacteria bacterium]|nr:hypothetical protein [Alphaproteobacteria bacterium]